MQRQPHLLQRLEAYSRALAPCVGPFLESVAEISAKLFRTHSELSYPEQPAPYADEPEAE